MTTLDQALEHAGQARAAIEEIVSRVRSGEIDLIGAFELGDNEPLMGRCFAVKVLEAVPGIGKVRARRTMDAIGIEEDAWLRDVSAEQRQAVHAAFDQPPESSWSLDFEVIDLGELGLSMNFVCNTAVDDLVRRRGHEPNGYFWEGIVQVIVASEAPILDGRFEFDAEGSMFCATSNDRQVLEALAVLMKRVTSEAERFVEVFDRAVADGFDFDD